MYDTSHSDSRRRAARVLMVVLITFSALHAYWAMGGSWGLETAIGPGAPRPSSGAIWGMAVALLLFAYAALLVSRAPTLGAPVMAHIALGVVSLGAAMVGCLNIVMGTRPAERLGIGPFAIVVALLAGYASSGRRRARAARLGSG